MKFVKFSKWVEFREQAPAAPAVPGKTPAAVKDDETQINTQIKQVMANNIGKPKRVRDMALTAKAKQMAMDPNIKPEELKKIQKVIDSDDPQAGQQQQ